MSHAALKLCVPEPGRTWSAAQLASVAPCLERQSAAERIEWALNFLPGSAIMTSSFGAQSAVMLHLLTQASPEIPVVLIDTGYLFPETYAFIDELTASLSLNLKVYRSRQSPAWQESRHGRLWEQGTQGIELYNQINKVEPMAHALADLRAGTWFSGLRRSQSASRRRIAVVQPHGEVVKVHPLADWNDRDIHHYLKDHELPYHPLWAQGFVSIGDHHTSRPMSAVDTEDEARFFGLVRECGLHQPERYRLLRD